MAEKKAIPVELPVMLLAGKYWHELTEKEVQSLFDSGLTYGWLVENIKQPDWCEYPEALMGDFGCTSLVLLSHRRKISKEYCKNCDCYRKST